MRNCASGNDEANIFRLLSAVHFAAMALPRIRS
jgi:hypothetical protein